MYDVVDLLVNYLKIENEKKKNINYLNKRGPDEYYYTLIKSLKETIVVLLLGLLRNEEAET